jgi:hypothetical protein
MGDGRAGDGALGRIAVTPAVRVILVPCILASLCGCRFGGDLVAAAAGGATGAATANPAVGIAVGVAVNSGIDAAFDYVGRKWHQGEQDALATEVATMRAGESRPWAVHHIVPIGNEHGEVEVTRDIVTPLTACKELVFSVQSGRGTRTSEEWYSTQVCQDGARWKWALAEPATERWGALQ